MLRSETFDFLVLAQVSLFSIIVVPTFACFLSCRKNYIFGEQSILPCLIKLADFIIYCQISFIDVTRFLLRKLFQQLCAILKISRIVEFVFARIMDTPIKKMLRCSCNIKQLIIFRAHDTGVQGETDRVVGVLYNVHNMYALRSNRNYNLRPFQLKSSIHRQHKCPDDPLEKHLSIICTDTKNIHSRNIFSLHSWLCSVAMFPVRPSKNMSRGSSDAVSTKGWFSRNSLISQLSHISWLKAHSHSFIIKYPHCRSHHEIARVCS